MLVREYKITQALQLWDSIFAYQCKFHPDAKKLIMLDYLCVAMLLNISDLRNKFEQFLTNTSV